MTLEIEHAGLSDQGPFRFRNEDFIVHVIPDDDAVLRRKGYLFAVCDGVGGSGSGDVASREAAQALVEDYYSRSEAARAALRKAVERANLSVYDLQTGSVPGGMQTTLSAIVLCGSELHLAHVGDSRVYRLRREAPVAADAVGNWEMAQLTVDHSEVAEMVKMQLISPDMMRRHPRRNIITRSLGGQPVVRGQYVTERLQVGDIFLLCTDGLWEPVVEQTMAEIVVAYEPTEACQRLIALAINLGTSDNISAQIIKIVAIPSTSDEPVSSDSLPLLRRLRQLLGGKHA